jgi:hypothetical protein
MTNPVLISFASKDRKIAMTICTALEHRGFNCWISSRNVPPGQNYQEAITRAIRAAKVMVLVFTANANNSEEIKKELALASRAKLIVIPLRVEDIAPNDAFNYEFATRQWIDMFEDWESSIDLLIEQIKPIAGATAQLRSETEVPERTPDGAALTPPIPHEDIHHTEAKIASPQTPQETESVCNTPLSVPAVEALPNPNPADIEDLPRPAPSQKKFYLFGEIELAPEVMRWTLGVTLLVICTSIAIPIFADGSRWPDDLSPESEFHAGVGALIDEKDYGKAFRWFSKAAEKQYAPATAALASMYNEGEGRPRNYNEAFRFWLKAATQGDPQSQSIVGYAFADGQYGQTKNSAAAHYWLGKAAGSGDKDAAEWLRVNR